MCDQFEQKAHARLPADMRYIYARPRIQIETAVYGDAAEIKLSVRILRGEGTAQQLTEHLVPVAFECLDTAEDRDQQLGKISPLGVGDRQDGPGQPPDCKTSSNLSCSVN